MGVKRQANYWTRWRIGKGRRQANKRTWWRMGIIKNGRGGGLISANRWARRRINKGKLLGAVEDLHGHAVGRGEGQGQDQMKTSGK